MQSWFSPSYPIGAFSYSHGLETAILSGTVTGTETLIEWVGDVLRFGAARNDAILLSHASTHDADLVSISQLAEALASSRERHIETMAQGAAFAKVTAEVYGTDPIARPYPVAVGTAVGILEIDVQKALSLFLHAFSANLVSAAVRFLPLGQTAGQRCLAALFSVIEDTAARAHSATLDDLGSATILTDLAAIQHETQKVRIFRT